MIPELNKVYIMPVSHEAAGMTTGADDFLMFTSDNMPYVSLGKVQSAFQNKVTVTCYGKVFTHKGKDYQAVTCVVKRSAKVAKQRIKDVIKRLVGK